MSDDEQRDTRGYFYKGVARLGNVAVSRHAQERMRADGVPLELFERVLLMPNKPDLAEGADMVWRERDGLRVVILTKPVPDVGAKLVKTVYRVKPQARAR